MGYIVKGICRENRQEKSPARQEREDCPEHADNADRAGQRGFKPATAKERAERNAYQDGNRHQRQKERPGVEQEKQGVGTINQKRDRKRQPVEDKPDESALHGVGRIFVV